jgi:hypothetical protein
MPTLANIKSLKTWLKIMFIPISTLHYTDKYFDQQAIDHQKVYMPAFLVTFLTLARVLGFPFRLIQSVLNGR